MISYAAHTPQLVDFSWFILLVAIFVGIAIWLRNK